MKWKGNQKQATNYDKVMKKWRDEMTDKSERKQQTTEEKWNNKYKVIENNGTMKNALKASNKKRQSDENIREHKMK